MRVIVCGGRDYADDLLVGETLQHYLDNMPELLMVQGGASGADLLAKTWCEQQGVPCATFKAEWSKHGKSAGPLRNAAMLATVEPDVVVAFPGGRGTADMVRRARKAGVAVLSIGVTEI